MSSLMSSIMQEYGHTIGHQDKEYFPKGFHLIDLSEKECFRSIQKQIFACMPQEAVYHIPYMTSRIEGYKTHSSPELLKKNINFKAIYYLDDPLKKVPDIINILKDPSIYDPIAHYYKNAYDSSFGIYHVCVYRNFKTEDEETGYLKWHKDNFPVYIKKLLIYLDDILTEEDGPTQIKYEDGHIESVYGKAGTAIFFDMNFMHRGAQIQHSSKNGSRNMIFLSLCPTEFQQTHTIQSLGVDAVYPTDLNRAFSLVTERLMIPSSSFNLSTATQHTALSDDINWLNDNISLLDDKNVYIWGMGRSSQEAIAQLSPLVKIRGYIEWENTKKETYHGLEVFPPDILLSDTHAFCIVTSKRWRNLVAYLDNNMFMYKKDFIIKENNTCKETMVPLSVGKRTYGENSFINHPYFKLRNFQGIKIGAFCSIGPNVQLLGNHIYENRITTHPFIEFCGHGEYVSHEAWEKYQEYNGITTIGNDVWIGANVSLKSGITIGNGAVIGAHCVVTKDVPSYAIVAGVPGQILKYRYSEDKIALLNETQWWNWSDSRIKEHISLFKDEKKFFELLETLRVSS